MTQAIDITGTESKTVDVVEGVNSELLKDFENDEVNKDISLFDEVDKLWAIYNSIVPIFKAIFNTKEAAYLLKIVNYIRYASHVGFNKEKTEKHIASLKLLKSIMVQAEKISCFVYKSKLIEDHEAPETNKQHLEDLRQMKLSLYRYQKQWRKDNRPIPYSMFTPGTIVERLVEHVDKEVGVFTVKHISNPNIGYVIIHCEEVIVRSAGFSGNFPVPEEVCFNSAHVTKVIKHIPGKVVYKSYHDSEYFKNHSFDSRPGKSKNVYRTQGVDNIIMDVMGSSISENDLNRQVNSEMLNIAILTSLGGSVRRYSDEENTFWTVIEVNKKKYKRRLKQLYNKFLISRRQQELNEEEHERQMGAEIDADYYYGDEVVPKSTTETIESGDSSDDPAPLDELSINANRVRRPRPVVQDEMDPGI